MSAGRYSFTIEQGATLDFELAYKDSDNEKALISIAGNVKREGLVVIDFMNVKKVLMNLKSFPIQQEILLLHIQSGVIQKVQAKQ